MVPRVKDMPNDLSDLSDLSSIAVLIPAWRPDAELLRLAAELSQSGVGAVIVVHDGSGPEYRAVFAALAAVASVHLLRHAVNRGKGRALKTGIQYVLKALPACEGLVTADADGQHTVTDILRVAEVLRGAGLLERERGSVVLGSRAFTRNVPWRSGLGNRITRRWFAAATGTALSDTQTGLRGFPRSLLSDVLLLEGERYEFEMAVLAHVCRHGARPVEVPIETVYLDGNRSSHFHPLWDSLRISGVLLRFWLGASLPRPSMLQNSQTPAP